MTGAGPRQNLVLEGLTYAASGTLLASEVEGLLLQDGPEATTTSGSLSRITLQARTGPVLAQYAYPRKRDEHPERPVAGLGGRPAGE
jgi:hypothetical protein